MAKSHALSIAAGIAILGCLLFLIYQGILPGESWFRVSRIEFYDRDGILMKNLTMPKFGSYLIWIEKPDTPFSYCEVFADYKLVIRDYTKTPGGFDMNVKTIGKTANGQITKDFGTVAIGPLVWTDAGKSYGDPGFQDWQSSGTGKSILRLTASQAEAAWGISSAGLGPCYLQYQLLWPDLPAEILQPTAKTGGNIMTITVNADPVPEMTVENFGTSPTGG